MWHVAKDIKYLFFTGAGAGAHSADPSVSPTCDQNCLLSLADEEH